MSQAIDAMVNAAINTLGLGETNGDNTNYVTEWYGLNDAWCDMAVTYWAYHSNNAEAVCFNQYHDYTVEHAQAFKDRGQWYYDTAGIRRGDIVFFDWAGSNSISAIDHVGLVESVDPDGTVHTIEGNISNVCARKLRYSNYIVGYGRPAYAADPTPPPPPAGDTYTVVAGDTMSAIARKLGCTLDALIAANPQVTNPDEIDVGQVLNVPSATPPPPPATPPFLSLFNLNWAVQNPGAHRDDVTLFQKALAKAVGLDYSNEVGLYGGRTVGACAKFQRSQGWSGADADGYPGPETLSRLASKSGLFVAAE